MFTSQRYGVTAKRHPSLTWKTGSGLADGGVCAIATDVNVVRLANNAANVIFLLRIRWGCIVMIVIVGVSGLVDTDRLDSLALASNRIVSTH